MPAGAIMTLALSPADYAVLGAYAALLVSAGWWLSRRASRASASEYFLAGRSMPAWAVAISILATAQSAATFVGAPEQGAKGDFRYLLANVGVIIAAIVVTRVFIPVYYRLGVATPYELLERSYGTPVRRLASVWYLGGRLMASGARVYVGAIPFCLAVFGEITPGGLLACVAGFMAFGAVFTLFSGARGAIWSDVIQVGVYLGAAVVILVLVARALPMPLGEALGTASRGAKVLGTVADAKDLKQTFTPLTAVTGLMLLNLAFFAMDQDLTQRLLACKNAKEAAKSLLINSVVVTLPVVGLFMVLGMALGMYYRATGAAADADAATMLVDFSLHKSPAGIAGLMLAGVLAAGPAGINSSLNAMASSFIADLYRPMRPEREERHYVRAGQIATIVIGALMAAFAAMCVHWHGMGTPDAKSILDFVLGLMIYAYAGLIGVFFGAVVYKRLPVSTGVIAMLAGLGVVVMMNVSSGLRQAVAWPWHLTAGAAASFAVVTVAAMTTRRTVDRDAA